MVILQAVNGQGDHFDVPFTELTAQFGSSSQLCGAHRGVISGVGEQDSPSGIKRVISEAASGALKGLRLRHDEMQSEVSKHVSIARRVLALDMNRY